MEKTMNIDEKSYLQLLNEVMLHGEEENDRTGVGTKSLFGKSLKFDLSNGTIPMLTSKKMFARGVFEELMFFIRGQTDSKILEAKGVNIWKGNTSREFLDKRGLDYPEGEMGPMYGRQWRGKEIDQLKEVFNLIKNDPNSRRIVMSSWDVDNLDKMVLAPCHPFTQFYVKKGKLDCQFVCRSTDLFLGFPFNVLSYAMLTHFLAKAAGLEAHELTFVGGDVHIYKTHYDAVREQLKNEPYDFPTMKINKELSSIEDIEKLEFIDIKIENYQHHTAIKAEMAI